MCGLRDLPTVRHQKLSGAEAENCLREVDVPEFQGFGIFFHAGALKNVVAGKSTPPGPEPAAGWNGTQIS